MNIKMINYEDQIQVKINNTVINLKYDNYVDLIVLEQPEYYQIGIIEINLTSSESKLHVSNYLAKGNISDKEVDVNAFKESFKTYHVPDVVDIGYITTRTSNYKYLKLDLGKNNSLILNEDNSLYILK